MGVSIGTEVVSFLIVELIGGELLGTVTGVGVVVLLEIVMDILEFINMLEFVFTVVVILFALVFAFAFAVVLVFIFSFLFSLVFGLVFVLVLSRLTNY